jgi:hypothetical protein
MKSFKSTVIKIPSKTNTLGIDRKNMPQVKSTDLEDFISYLKKKGVNTTKKSVDASKLKASQGNFDKEKISKLMQSLAANELPDKPILVSKDNYVIDGHHRWLAFLNLEKDMNVYQVNVNIDELMGLMNTYPKKFTKQLYEFFGYVCEADETCSILTPSQMKAFESVVDKLFKKYNIDFDFTKHFRERMSDGRNDPCIDIKELANLIKKIYSKYQNGEKSLNKFMDAEVVIKDLQSDLNMPVAIEYDRKNDELNVIAKTIMRKKNFRTPNPEIKL